MHFLICMYYMNICMISFVVGPSVPLLPKYYYVRAPCVQLEREQPGSQHRVPSAEGSSEDNVFLWGQALLIISDLLASRLVNYFELDPICRHLSYNVRHQRNKRVAAEVGFEPLP